MDELEQLLGDTPRTTTILMWVAIGLGLVFLGLLIFDDAKRQKEKHRYESRHKRLCRVWTLPFRRARAFCQGLRELARHRDRSSQLEHRKHTRSRRRGSRQQDSSPL